MHLHNECYLFTYVTLKNDCVPYLGHNQLIVWFASVLDKKQGQVAGGGSSDFLKKKNKTYNVHMQVCYLTCSAK